VELDPNDAPGHKVLAAVYGTMGRQADAAVEWERAAASDPTDSSPYYHLYRIYLAMGRQEEATSAYAKFKKLSKMY
jgi:DNA-binding SARP family transcriptional activator